MPARYIIITVIIARFIIVIGIVGIIRNGIITADNRVLRLTDIQFIEALNIFRKRIIIQIGSQPVISCNLTFIIYGIALRVNTAQPRIIPCFQVRTVALKNQIRKTDISDGTVIKRKQFLKQGKSVQHCTILNPQPCYRAKIIKYNPLTGNIRQRTQGQRLIIGRKMQEIQWRPLCKRHGRHCRASRSIY